MSLVRENDDGLRARLDAADAAELATELATELASIESGDAVLEGDAIERVAELLAHTSKTVRRRAAGALAATIDDRDEGGQGSVRPELRTAALAELRRRLDDPVAERRWGAAFALASAVAPDSRVFAVALEALADRDGDVRWAAAAIVTTAARSDDGIARSLGAALSTTDATQRKMVVYCMRDAGIGKAAGFAAALDDADPDVRKACLLALASSADVGAAEAERVVGVLEDDADVGVRRAAAAVLGRLSDASPAVVAALERTVRDGSDRDTVRAATAALARARPGENEQ